MQKFPGTSHLGWAKGRHFSLPAAGQQAQPASAQVLMLWRKGFS